MKKLEQLKTGIILVLQRISTIPLSCMQNVVMKLHSTLKHAEGQILVLQVMINNGTMP